MSVSLQWPIVIGWQCHRHLNNSIHIMDLLSIFCFSVHIIPKSTPPLPFFFFLGAVPWQGYGFCLGLLVWLPAKEPVRSKGGTVTLPFLFRTCCFVIWEWDFLSCCDVASPNSSTFSLNGEAWDDQNHEALSWGSIGFKNHHMYGFCFVTRCHHILFCRNFRFKLNLQVNKTKSHQVAYILRVN